MATTIQVPPFGVTNYRQKGYIIVYCDKEAVNMAVKKSQKQIKSINKGYDIE